MIKSKSQEFANAVFPNVRDASVKDYANKYKTLSKKAGSLVRNSGLMQTLAFFLARGQKSTEKHHRIFYNHLQSELRQLKIIPDDKKDLFDYVRQTSVPEYMYLTREILHLLNWHKRLADTLISKDQAGEA